MAAAAAAPPASYSSLMASVAMTPMAQSHRLKKVSSLESSSVDADKTGVHDVVLPRPSNIVDHPSQFSATQGQKLNGGSFHVSGGVSHVKILSKSMKHVELNGSESRSGWPALHTVGNGANSDRIDFSQSKGASHGRPGSTFVGKQQSRSLLESSRTVLTRFLLTNRILLVFCFSGQWLLHQIQEDREVNYILESVIFHFSYKAVLIFICVTCVS